MPDERRRLADEIERLTTIMDDHISGGWDGNAARRALHVLIADNRATILAALRDDTTHQSAIVANPPAGPSDTDADRIWRITREMAGS